MALSSAIGAYPYPALSDPPNAQTFGANLTAALDLTTLPKFTSDAAVAAAIPSPSEGQRLVRTDVGVGGALFRWSASLARWIADSALIAETVLGNSTTQSVSFLAIPQYWQHLRLVITGQCASSTGTHKYGVETAMRLNADTTSTNYTYNGWQQLDKIATGSTVTYGISLVDATGGSGTNTAPVPTTKLGQAGEPGGRIGIMPGETLATLLRGCIETIIPDYTSANAEHAWFSRTAAMSVANAGNSYALYGMHQGGWATSAAITSLTVGIETNCNFNTGTKFQLYGF